MPAYYFDSSALVKCYIAETGSSWVRSVAAPASANDLHVLQLAEVEVVSAIVRRRRNATIQASAAATAIVQLRSDLGSDYVVISVTERIVELASTLTEKYALRAYDAIQLAGAVELNRVRVAAALPEMALVSADVELNAAAVAEGLVVEDPNLHP